MVARYEVVLFLVMAMVVVMVVKKNAQVRTIKIERMNETRTRTYIK